jgi:hypothetical protein
MRNLANLNYFNPKTHLYFENGTFSNTFRLGKRKDKETTSDSLTTQSIVKPVENIITTKDQRDRRFKSEKYCKAHNVPIYANPNSLFVDPENTGASRTQDEVVNRALALVT